MRDAMSLLLGSAPRARAAETLAKAGFEIVDLPDIAGAMLVREVESRRRGGGAYVVRGGSRSHLIVQAPHTFFDEGTLPLACELFQRADAAALFINTVHRYKGAAPDAAGNHPADVAHAPDSLFEAATEGALTAIAGLTAVQVHGFAARESGARAVVSSGDKRGASPLATRAKAALDAVVGGGVLLFPDDTSELGATTNVQGNYLRQHGGRFLHVEMSEGLRRELQADPALRERALTALAREASN
jgi:hypothetical protein